MAIVRAAGDQPVPLGVGLYNAYCSNIKSDQFKARRFLTDNP